MEAFRLLTGSAKLAAFVRELPEEARHELQALRDHLLREWRPLSQWPVRRGVLRAEHARMLGVFLGQLQPGSSLTGVNLFKGQIAGGTLRGCNAALADVLDGEVHGVNVLAGAVHGGKLRYVNLIAGDVYGGDVDGCGVLVGNVFGGHVRVGLHVGDVIAGSVDAVRHVGTVLES